MGRRGACGQSHNTARSHRELRRCGIHLTSIHPAAQRRPDELWPPRCCASSSQCVMPQQLLARIPTLSPRSTAPTWQTRRASTSSCGSISCCWASSRGGATGAVWVWRREQASRARVKGCGQFCALGCAAGPARGRRQRSAKECKRNGCNTVAWVLVPLPSARRRIPAGPPCCTCRTLRPQAPPLHLHPAASSQMPRMSPSSLTLCTFILPSFAGSAARCRSATRTGWATLKHAAPAASTTTTMQPAIRTCRRRVCARVSRVVAASWV